MHDPTRATHQLSPSIKSRIAAMCNMAKMQTRGTLMSAVMPMDEHTGKAAFASIVKGAKYRKNIYCILLMAIEQLCRVGGGAPGDLVSTLSEDERNTVASCLLSLVCMLSKDKHSMRTWLARYILSSDTRRQKEVVKDAMIASIDMCGAIKPASFAVWEMLVLAIVRDSCGEELDNGDFDKDGVINSPSKRHNALEVLQSVCRQVIPEDLSDIERTGATTDLASTCIVQLSDAGGGSVSRGGAAAGGGGGAASASTTPAGGRMQQQVSSTIQPSGSALHCYSNKKRRTAEEEAEEAAQLCSLNLRRSMLVEMERYHNDMGVLRDNGIREWDRVSQRVSDITAMQDGPDKIVQILNLACDVFVFVMTL